MQFSDSLTDFTTILYKGDGVFNEISFKIVYSYRLGCVLNQRAKVIRPKTMRSNGILIEKHMVECSKEIQIIFI